jgi:hypothetical protein
MDAVGQGFGAGRLDSRQAVGQHRRQHLDHLAVAIIRALQLTPQALQAGRQEPVLEGGAVPQCARLPGEHRDVMPGIVDRLAAAETAVMLADDCAILADHNAIGVSLDLDWPADGARGDRVFVVVEAYQAGLRDRRLRRVEPVE